MGTRSGTETVAGILVAFAERHTWSQADLARRLELKVPALRKRLAELERAGIPFDKDDDHPHVYWSVPKDWFPGGAILSGKELSSLLRALLHLPRSASRDRLLRALTAVAPREREGQPSTESVVTPELTEEEERVLAVIEDSMARAKAVRLRYQSRTSGVARWRYASVHRVVSSSPLRMVVTCHETGELRWFRLDHVRGAEVDEREAFRRPDSGALRGFLAASVDGFHDGGAEREVVFLVREPASRWVAENLPEGCRGEFVAGGLRVRARTSAVEQVARFVVGLGASARAESAELGARVKELALGALGAERPRVARARGNVRAVVSKRARG